MKAALSLLVLVATISLARAGSFAGPPPFTNGSPLQSGTDGTYQAVVSGTNISGVFSFVISGGIQTSDSNTIINSWVFFVDGTIFQGSVVAAISQSQVLGILNGGTNTLPFEKGAPLELPSAFIIPANTASGQFNGSISLNSPIGAFEGSGIFQGTPERTDQLLFINNPTTTQTITATGTTTTTTTATTQTTNIKIPAATVGNPPTSSPFGFKFHGTRLSTTPAKATAAAAPSPAA
jgi:hypothetical protein